MASTSGKKTPRHTKTGRNSSGRSTSKAAQTRKINEETKALRKESFGFIWLITGIILMVIVLIPRNGQVDGMISGFLLSLFGSFGRIALGIVMILSGIKMLAGRPRGRAWLFIAAACISVMRSIALDEFPMYSLNETVLWRELWSVPSSGGIIIGGAAKALGSWFNHIAVYVALTGILIVSFIFIFRTSLVGVIRKGADRAMETAHAIKEKIPERQPRAKTLDFDDAVTVRKEEKPRKQDGGSSIDLRKTSTVLRTKSGDELLYVRKGALKKGPETMDDFSGGKAVSGVPMTQLDDFSERKQETRRPSPKSRADIELSFDKAAEKAEKKKALSEEKPSASPGPEEPKPAKEKAEPEKVSAADNDRAREEVSRRIEEKKTVPEKRYRFPSYALLKPGENVQNDTGRAQLRETAVDLIKALEDFGVEAQITDVTVGPAVTRFELTIQSGTRVKKVADLADDIAYALAAKQVRIEAPIPGKSAVGIEIPNAKARTVRLSQIIKDKKFTQNKSPLSVALGQTLTGETLVMDIKKMPHMLIAGATGSGKSVCINTIIVSILYHSAPSDVRMILIDPKMVELNVYNGIPHLLIPVVTNPKEAGGALGWAVREMESRYEQFKENKVRDIDSYNSKMLSQGGEKMAHIVLIIDELSDLMMVAAQQVETYICRLAQLARAAGIHLILATQRPSVNVITGLIKANISSRISFAVTSQIDSRTILDRGGAEKLLGRGDMLYKPIDENDPIRAQCAFVDDDEIEAVVGFIRDSSGEASYNEEIQEQIRASAQDTPQVKISSDDRDVEDDEKLLLRSMELAFRNKGKISTSMVQRKLGLGYARAGRIIDMMEERGYISEADGSKPRQVLVSYEELFGDE